MSLIHWQPLKDLETLRHQMNQMFDTWTHHDTGGAPGRGMTWTPAIELKQTETDIVLKAEVPGVDAKDLDVQVTENAVSIAGSHHAEERTETEGMVHCELRYGQFQRWVPLPTPVHYEQAKADFKNGILTLTLPKLEPTQQPVFKVNLEDKLRTTATQNRLDDEHRQQTVHRRAEDALETMSEGDLDQAVRETVTQDRQHEEHRQDAVHMRAKSEG